MAVNTNMKTLIVDDMKSMRVIVKKLLVEMGFNNITEATDGSVAMQLIEAAIKEGKPFEFIVSDWNMPEMTGIDLLKKVRSTPGIGKTPFLMVTAESEQNNIVLAVKAGVSNFIVKPFSGQTLKDKVDKIFNNDLPV